LLVCKIGHNKASLDKWICHSVSIDFGLGDTRSRVRSWCLTWPGVLKLWNGDVLLFEWVLVFLSSFSASKESFYFLRIVWNKLDATHEWLKSFWYSNSFRGLVVLDDTA